MPTKRKYRARKLIQGLNQSLGYILGDKKLYPKPVDFISHGFGDDLGIGDAYPWWIDLENPGGTPEAARLIWEKWGPIVLEDWRAVRLRGKPSWARFEGRRNDRR